MAKKKYKNKEAEPKVQEQEVQEEVQEQEETQVQEQEVQEEVQEELETEQEESEEIQEETTMDKLNGLLLRMNDLTNGSDIAQSKIILISSLNSTYGTELSVEDISSLYNDHKDTVLSLQSVPAYLHLYDASQDAVDAFITLFTALGMRELDIPQSENSYLDSFRGDYAGLGEFTSQLFLA